MADPFACVLISWMILFIPDQPTYWADSNECLAVVVPGIAVVVPDTADSGECLADIVPGIAVVVPGPADLTACHADSNESFADMIGCHADSDECPSDIVPNLADNNECLPDLPGVRPLQRPVRPDSSPYSYAGGQITAF